MRSISYLPGVWSVRLRKVSRDWHRAFQYVPDEVVHTRIELQHSTYFNGFGDGLNKIIDYLLSLFILFAVPLLRLVTISTTKSSGHDPRHSSCYVSTVWSMLSWDVSFSLGAVQLSPLWDHTLVLVSPNLCYDIRFQVTLSRLVSLAKCCSEQFGCHQSASVFCCRYPLSSLGISADSCARQLCDKISRVTLKMRKLPSRCPRLCLLSLFIRYTGLSW